MPRISFYIICFFAISAFWTCNFDSSRESQMNGVLFKEINGLRIEVKEISANELFTKSKQNAINYNNDSLKSEISKSLHFLIKYSVAKDESKIDSQKASLIYSGITEFKNYKERIAILNFQIEDLIKLKTSKSEFKPVLTSFENDYGLSNEVRINVVFVQDSTEEFKDLKNYEFILNDEIFNTGISHFLFKK